MGWGRDLYTAPPGDSFYAVTGCVGPECITGPDAASLSQTLLTTNGDTYTLTFDFTTFGNSTPNELDVLWDRVSVLDLGPGGTLGPISTWTEYTVTGLVGDGADTLTFLGRQDPARDGLDNIDVELSASTTATPEPATFWMIGSALPALSILRRRWTRS